MTTTTITVHLKDDDSVAHEADYFQHENGWTALKTVAGRQVAAYPDSRITGLTTTLGPVTAAMQMEINAGATLAEVTKAHARASAEQAARWAGRS